MWRVSAVCPMQEHYYILWHVACRLSFHMLKCFLGLLAITEYSEIQKMRPKAKIKFKCILYIT